MVADLPNRASTAGGRADQRLLYPSASREAAQDAPGIATRELDEALRFVGGKVPWIAVDDPTWLTIITFRWARCPDRRIHGF
jgi:hypothetical protein